jgi:hypothetical protein
LVQVAPDRWNFRRSASGRPFVPVGVNYDHDMSAPCPLLLEEYWHDRWVDVERERPTPSGRCWINSSVVIVS